MNTFVQAVIGWLRQPDFEHHDKNLTALYIQSITLVIIIVTVILGLVYAAAGQIGYVIFLLADILIQMFVIGLIRFKKLQSALNLFLIAALALLDLGILSVGGIHASSVILYPVILLFASLLLDRKFYIAYVVLCITSIGFIIYAEHQKLIPDYVPDAPELPLFLSVGLIVLSAAFISRFITESLQNNIRKSRQYAQDLSNQKAMLEHVGQAVVGCQMDSTIVYWNQAAVDLYGWKAEEAVGRKYYDMVPTALTPEMTEGIRQALRRGEVWSGEMVIQKRDQSSLPVIGSIAPLRDEAGSVIGWIGIAADLSVRVKVAEMDKRRADEMGLLYRLGVALSSGKNLYDTLFTLQVEIVKFIRADAFYVAIYDEKSDYVQYPIFFDEGQPLEETGRLLHEWPGLTGAVIFSGKTLYLPDMYDPDVEKTYHPQDTNNLILHTFLGIPLNVDGRILGMLSVQSNLVDAYTSDQIQLMENIAVQAAIAIDKANLFDRLNLELVERRHIEAQLREREVILEAVTFAAEEFLKTSDWRVNINQVLERLGKALNVTHAYLFEDHMGLQGEALTSMKYEWTATGYPSDLDGPYFQNSKVERDGFEEQVETLRRGEVRLGNVSTFGEIEKENMQDLGVKAILEVPIFVNKKEWGAIGFDDFEQERTWSTVEVEALKIAAGVLSAAIQRQDAEAAVHESERIYRQAIEAAGAVPYYRKHSDEHYVFMGDGIEKIIGYKPEEITIQLWLDILKENIPLGEGVGLPIDAAVLGARSGTFKVWKSDMRVVARNGEERWLTDSAVELFDDADMSYASIGIMQDVTDRKMTEAVLRKRESMLETVAFAAEQFLKTADWREKIDLVLERLGMEFNASHAYLFEKHENSRGELLSSMTHEWTAPDCISDLDDPEYQEFSTNPSGNLKRVYEILDRGEPFVGSSSLFSLEEREYYVDTIHIKALLEMRIVVDGKQWGALGFDELTREREWTPMEVDMLKVATNVLGAAIKRQLDEAALQKELDERKRAEQALRFSEEKFSKAFDTTQVLMTIEDDKNVFIDVNQAFIESFGFDRNEVIGHSSIELNIFYDPADVYKLREAFQQQGYLKDLEIRFRRKSGELGFILLSSERIYVDNIEYTLTSGLDITKRKRAEGNYYNIFNNSIDGIFQSTDDGRFITVNPAMARIYGYDSPEDMVQSVSDIGTQLYVDAGQRIEVRHRLSSGERLIGYEAFEYRKDKSTFWSSTTVQAVRNENDQVLYYEGTVEDITPRKQAEREKLIADLEAKNDELERFTYTVSHDLKSPLVTINGFLGYLEQDATSGNVERLKKDVQRIHDAVNKMEKLLNELLELSRIGRMMNPPETASFQDLIYEAIAIVQGRLSEHNVTVNIESDLPSVFVDKPRVVEILQNLLDNAAKYTGTQPEPHIDIGQRGEEQGLLVFYVKDNGMGVAPEYHERIFGLFNKLDPKTEGTGVGLALVKRIIEVHGGRIWIESQAGQGATFCFTLPRSTIMP